MYNPPSPSISEEKDTETEKDLTPAQNFLLSETTKQPLAIREKVAFAEKVRLSGNLNTLFPKHDAVFENNDQKPFDGAEPLSSTEMTIPQTQVMLKVLNEGTLPKQLKFFSGGSNKDDN